MLMAPPHTTATAYGGCGVSQTFERKVIPFGSADTTLFIIDWDDTVLSSSWLAGHGLRLDSPHVPQEVVNALVALQEHAYALLLSAIKLGKVALVTNAEAGWIELSCRKFLPGVLPLLSKVQILSARTTYENEYPGQTQMWKNLAYEKVFSDAFSSFIESGFDGKYNVLSLGDSLYERNALLRLGKLIPNAVVKSIKFIERPNCTQLQKELEIINASLSHLQSDTSTVDMMLTIEYLDEC